MAFNGNIADAGPFVIAFLLLLAISFRGFPVLRGLTFTTSILSVVAISLYYPQYFKEYNGFEFATLITPLIQVIMFGMGCSMGLKDFVALAKSPKSVIVGVVGQYTIMPLLGLALASFTDFPSEISRDHLTWLRPDIGYSQCYVLPGEGQCSTCDYHYGHYNFTCTVSHSVADESTRRRVH